MAVFVLAMDGTKLMPTTEAKAKKLLKKGRAHIDRYRPFTIRLNQESTKYVQPIELGIDAGSLHIGVSLKSEKHEYVSEQRDLLLTEKKRMDDRRAYRHKRRSRLRYRAPRFDNRRGMEKKKIAPSIENKINQHANIVKTYSEVAPIKHVTIEVGSFDTEMLKNNDAESSDDPTCLSEINPNDSQNLRLAVFARDNYTCAFCHKNCFKDGVRLHAHHFLYWKGRHGNRMDEMVTCCTGCHTTANHRPGGKLWGFEREITDLRNAGFMNIARWCIYEKTCEVFPEKNVHVTYGIYTTRKREAMCLPKTHVNDAYCIGSFTPKHRAHSVLLTKQRRNTRILEKFYDKKVIDSVTGKIVTGKELGSERLNRKEPRFENGNKRMLRGKTVKPGRRVIRTQRHDIRPGDIVLAEGKRKTIKSSTCLGTRVQFTDGKTLTMNRVKLLKHCGGWTTRRIS